MTTKQSSGLLNLFATTPKGLELLLADELRTLGATKAAEKLAGVEFTGDLTLAYKACLWSRLANRILLRLAHVPAENPEELYAGIQTIAWDEHIDPTGTLSVNFVTSQSNITHTLFGAQKVKDAIVDQLREKYQVRPSVDREKPDVSVNVYLYRNYATVSLDLSGMSLHKRSYRFAPGVAPLKENLAAAILLRAGWPAIAKDNGTLLDPMCGSATMLIEAAMMACDIAPGLLRDYFGFLGWKKHQPDIWSTLITEANARREQGMLLQPSIMGYDADSNAIKIAFENIESANLRGKIHVEKRDLSVFEPKPNTKPGLVVVNPPYGERLGEEAELQKLYAELGARLKKAFTGWQAAVLAGNPELGKNMGIRAKKYYALFNGTIPCQLLLFDINPEKFVDYSPAAKNARKIEMAKRDIEQQNPEAIDMFVNRVRKNIKHLKRWAEREKISCYRVYDADLPEYAFSIDLYEQYAYVREYHAPKKLDPDKVLKRQQAVLAALPEALDIPPGDIFFHPSVRRSKRLAVTPIVRLDDFFPVEEGRAKFLVDLCSAENATGLSLAQRMLRETMQTLAKNSHVLNLFDPSGAMTVSAALGGALTTKTIVESELSLDWVKRNLLLNNLIEPNLIKQDLKNQQHQVILADTLVWLDRERTRYHLIIAALPVMEERDLFLYQMLKLLLPDGVLLLTTRDPRFQLKPESFPEFKVEEMTQQHVSVDFERNPKIQRYWKIY